MMWECAPFNLAAVLIGSSSFSWHTKKKHFTAPFDTMPIGLPKSLPTALGWRQSR